MPEGDSIWRAAAELHEALAGKVLTASDFRVPRFATLDLSGWTVTEVVPRGKHLLIRVVAPAGEGGSSGGEGGSSGGASGNRQKLTIHSHLKMEGSWQVYPSGGRWRRPGHTARCVLRTAGVDVVGFSLGILEVVPTAKEDSVVGHLGPDLLGSDWDADEAATRILAAPAEPIGVALLDQRKVAGIGNVYRCEVCFLAGIHPTRPVAAAQDVPLMLDDAKRLLEANLGAARRATVGVRLAAGPTRGAGSARPAPPTHPDPPTSPDPPTHPAPPARPDPPASKAPSDERRAALARIAMRSSADARSRFRASSGFRSGQALLWVYGREHQPCLLCGTTIRRGVLGPASGTEDRDFYFCPGCQPPP